MNSSLALSNLLTLTKYVLLKASCEQSASLSLSVGEGLSGFPGLSPIPADKLTTMCNCSEEGHPPGIKPHNSPNDRNCKTKFGFSFCEITDLHLRSSTVH